MLERKSILAKLLAKENIDVRVEGTRTASFDVVNRVLRLPLWKDMGKDLYDLMVGHEVGHALYTPAEGWHESTTNFEFPRAYVNVIEDIRIERAILDTYPGLKRNFIRGYSELLDRDFFGLSKREVNTLGFMDRLNIKTKCRDLLDVPFAADELPYVKMATSASTFDEVIDACDAIYKWLKEKKDKNEDSKDTPIDGDQDNISEDSLEGETGSAESETRETADEEPSAEEPSCNIKESDNNDEEKDSPTTTEQSAGDKPDDTLSDVDPDEVFTDDEFRKNEDKLVEQDEYGRMPLVIKGFSDSNIDKIIVPWKAACEARKESFIHSMGEASFKSELACSGYSKFIDETKKVTSMMAKEFETRKAAMQYSRSKQAKTGKLNLNKLHSYKFNDDIFLQSTITPDAKSHGIVAFIDFSGSMQNIIGNVVNQAITLATFCRKVNIPFDIYSFTSPRARGIMDQEAQIDDSVIGIVHQLSSDMKRSEFEEAVERLYYAFNHNRYGIHTSIYDQLGSTPLNEALIIATTLLDRFKKKHNLQKVSLMTITDGDASLMYYRNYEGSLNRRKTYIDIKGKIVNASGYPRKVTASLLEHIRSLGYNTIGYYLIGSNSDINYNIRYNFGPDAVKEFRTNHVVSVGKFRGYDEYMFINGRTNALDDDFEVKDNANKGEIARAFKKFAKSKKGNRTLATKFAEAIS